jgi:hypothetical protein
MSKTDFMDWVLLDMNPLKLEKLRLLRNINRLLEGDEEQAKKVLRKLMK